MTLVRSALALCLYLFAPIYARSKIEWAAYERGELGSYPTIKFNSIDGVKAPLVHVTQSSTQCDHNDYILLSPFGDGIDGNKIYILDQRGDLVYFKQEKGAVRNIQIQRYRGTDYLTYWVGDASSTGFGRGYYKMLDQTYSLAYTISAVDDADGDFHEFSITPEGTALITAYRKIPWNLSLYGRSNGFIWDCVFQEIELETGELAYEWRASDHFTFADMSINSWEDWVGTNLHPWDWFHLNSVEKDRQGNFLISSRYANAITYIDGKKGSLLWHMGGKNSTFTKPFESNSRKLNDPHMARWTDDHTGITVFQNAGSRFSDYESERLPYGIKIKVESDRRHAEVASEFILNENLGSLSEGSLQILTNGNYLVGYGSAPVFVEFNSQGDILCVTHYSPVGDNQSNDLRRGQGESYRIYKGSWTALPRPPPKITFKDGTLNVIWNGATEVAEWKLEGSHDFDIKSNSWARVGLFPKQNFETEIPLSSVSFASYRLTALDSMRNSLRSWVFSVDGDIQEASHVGSAFNTSSAPSIGVLIIFISTGLLVFNNRKYLPVRSIVNGYHHKNSRKG